MYVQPNVCQLHLIVWRNNRICTDEYVLCCTEEIPLSIIEQFRSSLCHSRIWACHSGGHGAVQFLGYTTMSFVLRQRCHSSCACSLHAWFILRSWRRRRHVNPQRLSTLSGLYCVMPRRQETSGLYRSWGVTNVVFSWFTVALLSLGYASRVRERIRFDWAMDTRSSCICAVTLFFWCTW